MFDIKVKTKDFLRAIRIVENAILDERIDNSRVGIYIETKEDKLEFRAMGYHLFIKCYCDAEIINEGKIVIKHRLVEEYLRKVIDEKVEIKEENNQIKIVTPDSISNYSLIEIDEIPELDVINGVEYIVDKKLLLENIEKTQFAATTDQEKAKINCLKFEVEDKTLKLVATDSYRLMYREIEIEENNTNENVSVSVPLKLTQALLKIFRESELNEIIFRSEGTKVLFKLDDIEVISKVVELQFPDYIAILDNVRVEKKIKVNKTDLYTALSKVLIFVRDKKERKDVAEFLFTENKLKISGYGEFGNGSSELNIIKDCPDIKIYLNVKFILEYLATVKNSEILEIDMSDEISAVLFKEDDNKNNNVYLTMPLKI